MELIGVIICLIIIQFIIQFIWNLFHLKLNHFEITLKTDIKNIENKETSVIYIKGKGSLPLSGEDSSEVTFVSTVWDITKQQKMPILCFIPEFQMKGMYFVKRSFPIPYENPIIKDWVDLGVIIPEVCIFPRSKNRHLEVHLSILNQSGQIIKTYSSTTQFYNAQKGYEEITENKIKLFKITIQILMQISMADGKLDNTEGHFLSEKVEEFLNNYEDEEKVALKRELNALLKNSYVEASSKKIDLHSLLLFFNQNATQADKYELIKNCIDIMNVDKEVDEKELKIIDGISDFLKLDYKKINELKDIHILKGSDISCSSPESVLGIKLSWSHTDIQSHLKKEFIKWNSRMQNCSKESERNHIQYMLDLISEMRLKYEKKAG